MRPNEVLARETTADGEQLVLARRDGVYTLSLDGALLMTSRAQASERLLGELACAALAGARPRVLVGGLGFGYTLRAALDVLPAGARVVVREISAMVIAANRDPEVGALAGRPLADRRVTVEAGDVADALGREPYDAIVLDVDNGPHAFSARRNARLYSAAGIERIAASLARGGRLAVWAEAPDPRFRRRLERAGFALASRARRRANGGVELWVRGAPRRGTRADLSSPA